MAEVKEFKAKIISLGNSAGIIVPSWVLKAFEIEKGMELTVKLKKDEENPIEKAADSSKGDKAPHNSPVV